MYQLPSQAPWKWKLIATGKMLQIANSQTLDVILVHLFADHRMQGLSGDTFFLDEFAFRQFEGGHAAQLDISKEDFVARVHQLYKEVNHFSNGWSDGQHMAFCWRS